MAEPVSGATGSVSTAGVVIGLKVYGFLALIALAALLSWLVVIMTRMPRTRNEWVVGMVCTVFGSITSGAFVVQRFGLHEWSGNWWGMCALAGIIFICGLPFWAVVRWIFNYISKHEDATIVDVARDLKAVKEDMTND